MSFAALPFSVYSIDGSRQLCCVTAAASRATPMMESRSGRFGVSSRSRIVSPTICESGAPTGASSGSTRMPSCSPEMPSSFSEQIIPCDSTPRIFAALSTVGSPVCPSISFAPIAA